MRAGCSGEELALGVWPCRAGVDALCAEGVAELADEAVVKPDDLGRDGVDGLPEFVVVGVVAEGDDLVDAVAVPGGGVHAPAGEHDDVTTGEGGGEGGSCGLRGREQDAALFEGEGGRAVEVVAAVGPEGRYSGLRQNAGCLG